MKRRTMVAMAMLALGLGTIEAQTTAQWPEVKRETKPGSRWWWMGSAVDEANLRRNIEAYAQVGMGTLEITPIYGVQGNEAHELQYLSNGWMQALQTSQTAGEAQGMDIDMNGGTGWPFGGPWVKTEQAAGKLVWKNETQTADGSTALTMNVTSPEGNAPLQKVMAYQQDGDQQVADVTDHVAGNTLTWQAPAGQWLLLAIYNGHTGQQVKRAAPGGEGNVLDHYDADAVAAYLDHFDQRFAATGAQWPHSFFNDSYEVYGADWTPKMFDQFLHYRGYKLEEHMDQLLGLGKRKDTGNQVLADYRQTLSDMLLNNFTRQWTAWAHKHGATTRNQGHGSPGNLIDFYAAVDIPEIESFGITDFKISGLRTDPGFTSPNLSDLATLKYASSAAHVTGKPMTSSETFTWLAEHFRVSLSQMKPDLDLMFIAGVNHIFFHGTTYSPQEAQWPGWKFYASIDMSPTNSIWHDAPSMMAYATRCQSFLQMGSPDNDLLVYAPFQDAMHKNTGANAARLQLFDINTLSQKIPSMVTAVKNIEAAGLDCDFISDQLLLSTTYADGCLQTEAGTRYKALVVPVKTNMPQATKDHLDELAAQGATIVYQTDVATMAQLAQGEEMRTQLGLRTIRRKNATGHHYFVANLSGKDVAGMTRLAVPFQSIVLFDPLTGAMRQAHTEGDKVWIALKSGQSVILETYDTEVSVAEKDEPVGEMNGIGIATTWRLELPDGSAPTVFDDGRPHTWEEQAPTFMGTGTYTTTFHADQQLLTMANGGMRLDLGDVRESARVYLNDEYVGCAWSAPFTLDISGKLRLGDNTLRIEVTNLPANRIRQMDIDGTEWRIFKDVNILDVVNGSTSQSGVHYKNWSLVASGLNSDVRLVPLRRLQSELTARLTTFTEQTAGTFYPTYQLQAPSTLPITAVSVTNTDGSDFSDYDLSTDKTQLTITGSATDYLIVRATDETGSESETYLRANGAYTQQRLLDFTLDTAPACGWQVMTNKTSITGFNGTYDWRRAPKNSAKEVVLSEGVTGRSEVASYYFFYPGYGMAVSNDFTLEVEAETGDICLLSYLMGSDAKPGYQAADSLVQSVTATEDHLAMELSGRNSYHIYRMLQQYRPKVSPSAIATPLRPTTDGLDAYYSLQGVRTMQPQRGIYIRNGRKVILSK